MPRYKLTVAYDGTNFHGWQKQQPPGQAPLRTVQGVLEDAVRQVVREPIDLLGASRTDAGVHARGQVAAFTSHAEIPLRKLPDAITSRLPDDVQVRSATTVDDDFDPISDAIAKGYRFRFAHGRRRHRRPPLFDRHMTTWTAHDLDPACMNQAARRLLGEHDFASFTRKNHDRETTVRTIYDCKVVKTNHRRCKLEISGNGFLYNMIRIIGGTLIEVGRQKIQPDAIEEILIAKDREAAGPTLPPQGLCLQWVRYEG